MLEKRKIALVVGRISQARILRQFERLTVDYRVVIHAFQSQDMAHLSDLSCELVLYDEVAEMPGYIRGLEENLADADLIIACELTALSSFQACRTADKLGVPLGIYSSEWQQYLYADAPNIRAIQFDISLRADFFICNDSFAKLQLESLNVPANKISVLSYVVDSKRFFVSPLQREKFQKYIGIDEGDKVILFQDMLKSGFGCDVAIEAMRILVEGSKGDRNRLKLIVAGDGPHARELRYFCVEKGLARQVLFLSQDAGPFVADLYNAVDFVLYPAHELFIERDDPPYRLREQLACGVVPIVMKGTQAAGIARGSAIEIPYSSPRLFAAALRALIDEQMNSNRLRLLCSLDGPSQPDTTTIIELVNEKLGTANSPGLKRESIKECLRRIDEMRVAGEVTDANIEIERLLLVSRGGGWERSEVLRARGDIRFFLSRYEDSMDSYYESIQHDPANSKSYRGLGFIAWQSHSNEEAIMFFRKSLALSANDPQVMLGLGLVHKRVGLLEQSMFWLEKAITFDTNEKTAIVALTQVCGEYPRPALAIESLKRTIETVGECRPLLMSLGNLYMKTGKIAEGRVMLAKALSDEVA
jgi:glycosyltransferase involved in cell wall biosynthesis